MLKGENKMITPEEESAFKVGDWVVMKQEFINKLKLEYVRKNLEKRFSTPSQIINMTINNREMIIYHFDKKRFTHLIKEFRFATKSEIKSQQIKDIFRK
jgi:hypothetical protein